MSQVNVEIVRRAFDSINRGDVDAALEAAADDFAERLRDDRWRIHWRKHPAARMSMRRGAHHYHLRPYRTEGAQPRCPKP